MSDEYEEMAKATFQQSQYAPFLHLPKAEFRVVREIVERAKAGREKYGTTTDRTDLSRKEWLQNALEEALDLAVYLQRLIDMESFDRALAAKEKRDGN